MIAKAMDWIKEHCAPSIREIDGTVWTDKRLEKVENRKAIDKVELYTLTSLVEYLKSKVDVPNDFISHIFINIVSPKEIMVYSEANKNNYYKRANIAQVTAQLPKITIGEWLDQTKFCIMLRANFIDWMKLESVDGRNEPFNVPATDRDALIKVASNIVSGSIATYEDTGITQKATLKTGIQESEDKLLPEKVVLCPYRTFMEVEQPASEFIFRAEDGRNGVQLSLHEADGGQWKIAAMTSIKDYLTEELAGIDYITILA